MRWRPPSGATAIRASSPRAPTWAGTAGTPSTSAARSPRTSCASSSTPPTTRRWPRCRRAGVPPAESQRAACVEPGLRQARPDGDGQRREDEQQGRRDADLGQRNGAEMVDVRAVQRLDDQLDADEAEDDRQPDVQVDDALERAPDEE